MVLKLTDRMADEIDDEVGRCPRELIAIQTWTGDELLLFEKSEKLVERERYFGELLTAVIFYSSVAFLHQGLDRPPGWRKRNLFEPLQSSPHEPLNH